MAPHIVVFDYSETLLAQFRALLERHGFDVSTYAQDVGVLTDFSQIRPDLIILGYIRGLPANYLALIERLRADPATQAVPILVCTTGEARPAGAAEPTNLHYASVVVEPLDLEGVLIGVHLALNLPMTAERG